MAKRMRFSVVGLPHYTVWHLYEPSVDDIRHMEEMEQERRNRENEEKERAERAKKIKEEFSDPGSQWEKDKHVMEGMNQKDEQIRKEHEAAMADIESKKGKDTENTKETVLEKAPKADEPAPNAVSETKEEKATKKEKSP